MVKPNCLTLGEWKNEPISKKKKMKYPFKLAGFHMQEFDKIHYSPFIVNFVPLNSSLMTKITYLKNTKILQIV